MKIGVFDSGVGGLTILKALYNNYPNYEYFYIGDNKNCPYGDKTKAELFIYASKIIDYFISLDINLIVIGCNTICSNIFDELKTKYNKINLVGVIDATVKEFLKVKSKETLIIGTTGTINSHLYEKKIKALDSSIKIHSLATPELVPMIEKGLSTKKVIKKYLEPYNNIDSIILACTHYKLIENNIQNLKIINSSDGVVNDVKKHLKESKKGSIKIYTTGNVFKFNHLCYKIMGIKAHKINLGR